MPLGLVRYQQEADDHFITFSCYGREPYLNTPRARDIFLDSLELTRQRYNFEVLGYATIPGAPSSTPNRVPGKLVCWGGEGG